METEGPAQKNTRGRKYSFYVFYAREFQQNRRWEENTRSRKINTTGV